MKSQANKLLSHCPLCKQGYAEKAVQSLGQKDGNELYHCTCHQCGYAMIAVVLEQAGLVSSIGMITDLEINDAVRFYKAEPISNNECVEAHRVLNEQSQAFCQELLDKRV